MPTTINEVTGGERMFSATLTHNSRITSPSSPEDVRQLTFSSDDAEFDGQIGQCIRVLAPGQFGNRYHSRLYSLADVDRNHPQRTELSLLVRRCSYIDDFSGQRYAGVASNYLCDLAPGAIATFTGPSGHPFAIPPTPKAAMLMIGMGTGIAPFRGLVRRIYDTVGGWQGRVRLFYGARSGLEMLYMNDQNRDLANYFDQATFKAFQAVSPRPHFGESPALEATLDHHADEVLDMLRQADTQVYIAGPQPMLERVETTLSGLVGGPEHWNVLRQTLVDSARWNAVLY